MGKITIQALFPDVSIQQKIFDAVDQLQHRVGTKRINLEKNFVSPSDFGKNIKYEEDIHDGHYSTSLHVGLQLEAFGKFLDLASSDNDKPIDDKYCRMAHSLMQKMSGVFSNEWNRLTAFRSILEDGMWNLEVKKSKSSRAISDCSLVHHVFGTGHVLVNFELKNELCGTSSCPNKQNIGYFVHFQAEQNCRSPMLLVSLAGPHYFQVFGAVWNGKDVCVDPLSDPISLLAVPRDPRHAVEKFARVLAAIDSTVERLKCYYDNKEVESKWGVKGPYPFNKEICNFKKFGDREWLFEAEYKTIPVCVKFVRSQYGFEVHQFLASRKLAPQLYTPEPEPLHGGWLAVVTEKVDGTPVTSSNLTRLQKQSLQDALRELHAQNYVHGDLRPQNILARSDKVCIIDFDWAGTCGSVRYPPELIIRKGVYHEAVECNGKIEKEHDSFQVNKLTT